MSGNESGPARVLDFPTGQVIGSKEDDSDDFDPKELDELFEEPVIEPIEEAHEEFDASVMIAPDPQQKPVRQIIFAKFSVDERYDLLNLMKHYLNEKMAEISSRLGLKRLDIMKTGPSMRVEDRLLGDPSLGVGHALDPFISNFIFDRYDLKTLKAHSLCEVDDLVKLVISELYGYPNRTREIYVDQGYNVVASTYRALARKKRGGKKPEFVDSSPIFTVNTYVPNQSPKTVFAMLCSAHFTGSASLSGEVEYMFKDKAYSVLHDAILTQDKVTFIPNSLTGDIALERALELEARGLDSGSMIASKIYVKKRS